MRNKLKYIIGINVPNIKIEKGHGQGGTPIEYIQLLKEVTSFISEKKGQIYPVSTENLFKAGLENLCDVINFYTIVQEVQRQENLPPIDIQFIDCEKSQKQLEGRY